MPKGKLVTKNAIIWHCINAWFMKHSLTRKKQVARLWQRDRAKLDTFLIKFQRYS